MKNQISAKAGLFIAYVPVAFVLCVIFAANSPDKHIIGTVVSAKADASANYAKYCSRCHGADGQAQTAKGKQTRATNLVKSRIGDAAGIKIIKGGKELMPGFKDNMSPEEIQQLMNYIRGFRQ